MGGDAFMLKIHTPHWNLQCEGDSTATRQALPLVVYLMVICVAACAARELYLCWLALGVPELWVEIESPHPCASLLKQAMPDDVAINEIV